MLLIYWRILYRNKLVLIGLTSLAVVAAAAATIWHAPVYQARTTIEIQDLNENFLNLKQMTPVSEGNSYTDLTDILTQIQLLQSRVLTKRALEKVTGRSSLAPKASEPHAASNVLSKGGKGAVAGPAAAALPSPAKSANQRHAGITNLSRIVRLRSALHLSRPKLSHEIDPEVVARNLKVRIIGQTRVLEVVFDSTDPDFAAAFANALADEFIVSNLEARSEMGQHISEWLTRQLEDMRIKLERSEAALLSYARQTGLIFTSDSSNPGRTNISDDKLRQLQQELSTAEADRIARQARWELTQNNAAERLPDVLSDSSLRALQEKVTELRRQRAELITTYTEKHSKVQRISAQLEPLEAALQGERAAIVDRLRNDYRAALRREKLLAADYAAQSALVTDQADKAIKYNILKREAESNRQMYEAMLQRVKESTIASAMRASNVRIVDPAEPPALPYKPSLPKNCLLGLLGGFLLGASLLIAREKANSTLQNPGDVQFWVDVPQLGAIPRVAKKLGVRTGVPIAFRTRSLGDAQTLSWYHPPYNGAGSSGATPDLSVAVPDGNNTGNFQILPGQRKAGPVTDSFRSLVTSVLFSGENGTRPRVLVVTSATAGEGKTTIATHLAISFAEIGHKVLIIDADLRRGRMHEAFGVPGKFGLSTLLQHDRMDAEILDRAVQKTTVPGLSVLPVGSADDDPAHKLFGANVSKLFARFKKEFDMVIIDTPPMLQMPDARLVGRLADAVILVTRADYTTREAALAASQRFIDDGTKILGTILNDWDPKASGGVYGYHSTGVPYYAPSRS
jgi:capsular exopolysaccharide synthesis family protein